MALVTRSFQTVLKRVLTLLWLRLSVRELRLKCSFMNTLKVLLLNLKQWSRMTVEEDAIFVEEQKVI